MRLYGLGSLSALSSLSGAALDTIASTIQQVEGYYPGSLAYDNNNPGNLIYTNYYAQNFFATPGRGGFSKFPDYDTGYAAMVHQIQIDAQRGDTIADLTYSWLGSGQGGDYLSYANSIAGSLGVPITTRVQDLINSDATGIPPVNLEGGPTIDPSQGSNVNTGAVVGIAAAALVGILVFSR